MSGNIRFRPRTPEICPVCGEEVPRDAVACPQCGADHDSGWREDAGTYDGVNVSGEDFDYDEFIEQEFGCRVKPAKLKTIWWLAGIALIIALTLYFFAAR